MQLLTHPVGHLGIDAVLCRAQGRKVGELTGHTKRVTDAKFLGHQDLMVTTSADKTSRLWAVDGDAYKCKVGSCLYVAACHDVVLPHQS